MTANITGDTIRELGIGEFLYNIQDISSQQVSPNFYPDDNIFTIYSEIIKTTVDGFRIIKFEVTKKIYIIDNLLSNSESIKDFMQRRGIADKYSESAESSNIQNICEAYPNVRFDSLAHGLILCDGQSSADSVKKIQTRTLLEYFDIYKRAQILRLGMRLFVPAEVFLYKCTSNILDKFIHEDTFVNALQILDPNTCPYYLSSEDSQKMLRGIPEFLKSKLEIIRGMYYPQYAFPKWTIDYFVSSESNIQRYKSEIIYAGDMSKSDEIYKLVTERDMVNIAMERGYNVDLCDKLFGFRQSYYSTYFQKHQILAPNVAIYTLSNLSAHENAQSDVLTQIHLYHAVGYAFDHIDQPDYIALKTRSRQYLTDLYVEIFRKMFTFATNKKFKTLVMTVLGGGYFSRLYPHGGSLGFQKNVFAPAFYDAYKKYGLDLQIQFSNKGHNIPAAIVKLKAVIPIIVVKEFPFFVKDLEDVENTLIVNAWDPHSMIGNGNAGDPSLDGAVGRFTDACVMGMPMCNPWLKDLRPHIFPTVTVADTVVTMVDSPSELIVETVDIPLVPSTDTSTMLQIGTELYSATVSSNTSPKRMYLSDSVKQIWPEIEKCTSADSSSVVVVRKYCTLSPLAMINNICLNTDSLRTFMLQHSQQQEFTNDDMMLAQLCVDNQDLILQRKDCKTVEFCNTPNLELLEEISLEDYMTISRRADTLVYFGPELWEGEPVKKLVDFVYNPDLIKFAAANNLFAASAKKNTELELYTLEYNNLIYQKIITFELLKKLPVNNIPDWSVALVAETYNIPKTYLDTGYNPEDMDIILLFLWRRIPINNNYNKIVASKLFGLGDDDQAGYDRYYMENLILAPNVGILCPQLEMQTPNGKMSNIDTYIATVYDFSSTTTTDYKVLYNKSREFHIELYVKILRRIFSLAVGSDSHDPTYSVVYMNVLGSRFAQSYPHDGVTGFEENVFAPAFFQAFQEFGGRVKVRFYPETSRAVQKLQKYIPLQVIDNIQAYVAKNKNAKTLLVYDTDPIHLIGSEPGNAISSWTAVTLALSALAGPELPMSTHQQDGSIYKDVVKTEEPLILDTSEIYLLKSTNTIITLPQGDIPTCEQVSAGVAWLKSIGIRSRVAQYFIMDACLSVTFAVTLQESAVRWLEEKVKLKAIHDKMLTFNFEFAHEKAYYFMVQTLYLLMYGSLSWLNLTQVKPVTTCPYTDNAKNMILALTRTGRCLCLCYANYVTAAAQEFGHDTIQLQSLPGHVRPVVLYADDARPLTPIHVGSVKCKGKSDVICSPEITYQIQEIFGIAEAGFRKNDHMEVELADDINSSQTQKYFTDMVTSTYRILPTSAKDRVIPRNDFNPLFRKSIWNELSSSLLRISHRNRVDISLTEHSINILTEIYSIDFDSLMIPPIRKFTTEHYNTSKNYTLYENIIIGLYKIGAGLADPPDKLQISESMSIITKHRLKD